MKSNKAVKIETVIRDISSTILRKIETVRSMEELKTRIRKTGIPLKKFCRMCGVSYGRMVKYLNEFEEMPDHVRSKVEEVLKESESK